MKKHLKSILLYVVLIAVLIALVSVIFKKTESETLVLADVVEHFEKDRVISFVIDENNNIIMQVIKTDAAGGEIQKADGTWETTEISYKLQSLSLFQAYCGDYVKENTRLESYDVQPITPTPWWVSMLPMAGLLLLLVVLWIFFMGSGSHGGSKLSSFGKARTHTASGSKVTFEDVAGADEEKQELEEIVEFLKEPTKFTRLGAKIPHGVLLVGPPGTGKTLLAKAVAGEAGVPFYSISGSDFVEMYVGVGASRVRDLFETARKSPASIVFIDEIDAVGRHRGAGLGGGHDEREQTLNQLLVEMDGFGSHDGIIVMAATNRPDILDPALLRPGRFDRQITVGAPDIKGRTQILRVHAKNKPLEESVSLETVAKKTAGFTGADLANLLNEAALLAARRNKSLIGMQDIDDAFIRVVAGPKKTSRVMNERERKNTAYHEAGHAIVDHVLPLLDNVHQISIIPSGRALGYTMSLPTEDKYSVYKNELKEEIAGLLAGRAAESIVFGDISGGASNDIERATNIARRMVTQLGMSDVLGTIKYGTADSEVFLGRDFSSGADYSPQTAAVIDAEIKKLVDEGYATATQILLQYRHKLDFVAEFLLKHEVMEGDQFAAAMDTDATMEELEQMAEDKKRRSQDDNEAKQKQAQEARAAAEQGLAEDAGEFQMPTASVDSNPFDDNDKSQE
ncbi:MAG: ATP-dependent zinc metalloprotease FtsH [Clostridia bacterium]|nr:ATP-dependent zinc metalloprotease FtsH [Clostridia bacterium]